MRVELMIRRKDKKPLVVPQHYNHTIQGFIYNSIDKDLARFLHDEGYRVDSRVFKLFTFSNLYGKFKVDRQRATLSFDGGVKLTISSSIGFFIKSIANHMILRDDLYISGQDVEVASVEFMDFDDIGDTEVLAFISPVVAYSTMLKADGRKYTCFHSPGDPDYDKIISENLRKKYRAIYDEEPPEGDVNIIAISPMKQRMTKYKNFIIKGCTGVVKMTGPKELISVGLDCGFGSKSSQGFGCAKKVDKRG